MILELRAGVSGALRRPARPSPERAVMLGVGVAIGAAWVVAVSMFGSGAMSITGLAMGASMTGSMPAGTAPGPAMLMWTMMVVAMMLPATLPAVAYVGSRTLRWRRRRAMVTFVAAYLLVWLGAGLMLLVVSQAWARVREDVLLCLALLVATAWQLTTDKRRALRDCHRSFPLAPRGWDATRSELRFGLRNGYACVRSCWAMMVVMAVATSATVFWMATLTALVSAEKLSRRPRQAIRMSAWLLAGAAVIVGVSGLAG